MSWGGGSEKCHVLVEWPLTDAPLTLLHIPPLFQWGDKKKKV
jgi:hypothetical protein